jgi:multidrug efflux pump
VNHQGQCPSVTLSFNLAPNTATGDAVTAIQQTTADLHLPPSIATSFLGIAQAFQSSLSSTPILILAALIAVCIILGMLYESTIHPITIISTLPSSGLGALLTLLLFGFPQVGSMQLICVRSAKTAASGIRPMEGLMGSTVPPPGWKMY